MEIKTKIAINRTKAYMDDEQVGYVKNSLISLNRWLLADKAKLASLNIGIKLNITDNLVSLADSFAYIKLIAVDFCDFEDGRPYSQVHMLRTAWNYKGEILALNSHLDQLQSMLRCGVDSFEMASGYEKEDVKEYLRAHNICYQHSLNNTRLVEEFQS